MSEYLAAAAAKMGMPESLVMRSAEAKAKAQGVSIDDLLREWAGGEAAQPSAAAEGTPTPTPTPTEADAPQESASESASQPQAAESSPASAGEVEIVYETIPTPDTVSAEEALEWDQVTTVATAGITERPGSVVPRWLLALFVIVPLFALSYMFVNTDGLSCGESGLLDVSFDGELANCDLSAYAPGAAGGDQLAAAAFAEGQGLYSQCASCHGANGGGGVGPAFAGVTGTFSACTDHVEWVRLGSSGWPEATYGDSGKPVQGGMPGYDGVLSIEEIAAVAFYERVAFGGEALEDAAVNCGIVAADEGIDEGSEEPAEEAAGS
jgi:mono/diheme cytochrome c family protein